MTMMLTMMMHMQEKLMVMMSIADHDVGVWEMSMAAMLIISLPPARNADSHSLTERSLFILFTPSRLKTTRIIFCILEPRLISFAHNS